MQVTHEKIVSHANSLRGDAANSCELVGRYNRYVFEKLDKKNTATFSSALETLNAGFGDCGEHAVLLAALLRASGIPARVVLGWCMLSEKRYYYHAWVMAFTGSGSLLIRLSVFSAAQREYLLLSMIRERVP